MTTRCFGASAAAGSGSVPGRNRRYRVYYSLHHETQTVRVLHVRHWAREGVDDAHLRQLIDNAVGEQDDV